MNDDLRRAVAELCGSDELSEENGVLRYYLYGKVYKSTSILITKAKDVFEEIGYTCNSVDELYDKLNNDKEFFSKLFDAIGENEDWFLIPGVMNIVEKDSVEYDEEGRVNKNKLKIIKTVPVRYNEKSVWWNPFENMEPGQETIYFNGGSNHRLYLLKEYEKCVCCHIEPEDDDLTDEIKTKMMNTIVLRPFVRRQKDVPQLEGIYCRISAISEDIDYYNSDLGDESVLNIRDNDEYNSLWCMVDDKSKAVVSGDKEHFGKYAVTVEEDELYPCDYKIAEITRKGRYYATNIEEIGEEEIDNIINALKNDDRLGIRFNHIIEGMVKIEDAEFEVNEDGKTREFKIENVYDEARRVSGYDLQNIYLFRIRESFGKSIFTIKMSYDENFDENKLAFLKQGDSDLFSYVGDYMKYDGKTIEYDKEDMDETGNVSWMLIDGGEVLYADGICEHLVGKTFNGIGKEEIESHRKIFRKAGRKYEGEYVIPEGKETIQSNAFVGCKEITSVKIPSSVTTIECNAFNTVSSLKNATIYVPKAVTSIEKYAFGVDLKKIVFESETVDGYDSRMVDKGWDDDDVPPLIVVPKGCVETYKNLFEEEKVKARVTDVDVETETIQAKNDDFEEENDDFEETEEENDGKDNIKNQVTKKFRQMCPYFWQTEVEVTDSDKNKYQGFSLKKFRLSKYTYVFRVTYNKTLKAMSITLFVDDSKLKSIKKYFKDVKPSRINWKKDYSNVTMTYPLLDINDEACAAAFKWVTDCAAKLEMLLLDPDKD